MMSITWYDRMMACTARWSAMIPASTAPVAAGAASGAMARDKLRSANKDGGLW